MLYNIIQNQCLTSLFGLLIITSLKFVLSVFPSLGPFLFCLILYHLYKKKIPVNRLPPIKDPIITPIISDFVSVGGDRIGGRDGDGDDNGDGDGDGDGDGG